MILTSKEVTALENVALKIKVKAVCFLNLSLYTMTYFLVDVLREGELLPRSLRFVMVMIYFYSLLRYLHTCYRWVVEYLTESVMWLHSLLPVNTPILFHFNRPVRADSVLITCLIMITWNPLHISLFQCIVFCTKDLNVISVGKILGL